jgi:uncharacterized protein YqhQ
MAHKHHTHIGGQAVIEGVMMRGRDHWTVTVRRPDGSFATRSAEVSPWKKRFPFLDWPILRGVMALWESLSIAMTALTYSAQEASGEDLELSKGEMGLSMVFGMIFAVALFVVAPALLTNLLTHWIGKGVWWNLADGLIRVAIFFGYLGAVSMVPDIRRVFEYHGAEHKTIHAYEAGVPLEPDRVDAYSTMHVRCGTSFLLVVMVLAILVFSLLGQQPLLERILSRIVLLPVVAGLSYEVIKFAGNHEDNPLVKVIMWPGLALQAMTTRQPTLDQIEVAINSLMDVLRIEGEQPVVSPPAPAEAAPNVLG